jgi:hypothetical protein
MPIKKTLVIDSDDLKFAQEIALEAATKAAKICEVEVTEDLIAEAACVAIDGIARATKRHLAAIRRVKSAAAEAALDKICNQQAGK